MAAQSSILDWQSLWIFQSLAGYSPRACKQLDMNEHVRTMHLAAYEKS